MHPQCFTYIYLYILYASTKLHIYLYVHYASTRLHMYLYILYASTTLHIYQNTYCMLPQSFTYIYTCIMHPQRSHRRHLHPRIWTPHWAHIYLYIHYASTTFHIYLFIHYAFTTLHIYLYILYASTPLTQTQHLHPRVARKRSDFSRKASVSSSFLDDTYGGLGNKPIRVTHSVRSSCSCVLRTVGKATRMLLFWMWGMMIA